jgi:hypothetical protein
MFDLPAPASGEPQGPTHVERKLSGGTIAWIARHENRGTPVPRVLRRAAEPDDAPQARLRPRLRPRDPARSGEPGQVVIFTRSSEISGSAPTVVCSAAEAAAAHRGPSRRSRCF